MFSLTSPIQETKKCPWCQEDFSISAEDVDFYSRVSPVLLGKNVSIPSPKLCPECRKQRRMSFRNEVSMYKNVCRFTDKPVISIHHPDEDFCVIDTKLWWTGDWDGCDYGMKMDFEKSFFDQWHELMKKVPRPAVMSDEGLASENCTYTHDVWYSRNCYLTACAWRMDNCLYCNNCLAYMKDCVECTGVMTNCENCYRCVTSSHLTNCSYLTNSSNCADCSLGFYLQGCQNCFGCTNLKNKSYYFFNVAKSKEEYQECIKSLSWETAIKKYETEILPQLVYRENYNFFCENVAGEDLTYSKNCFGCTNTQRSQDCKYCYGCDGNKNCMDLLHTGESEWGYENITSDQRFMTRFSMYSCKCENALYCDRVHSCENVFGCVGLKNHKKFALLNTCYSQQEYEELTTKVIDHMRSTGEWGEFLHPRYSPYFYTETIAQEHFEMPVGDLTSRGFRIGERPLSPVENLKKIPGNRLPSDISQIPDDILNWHIECPETQKLFRVDPRELLFLRKNKLPPPQFHPNVRRKHRIKKKIFHLAHETQCCFCQKPISTFQSKGTHIACESCFREKFIG